MHALIVQYIQKNIGFPENLSMNSFLQAFKYRFGRNGSHEQVFMLKFFGHQGWENSYFPSIAYTTLGL